MTKAKIYLIEWIDSYSYPGSWLNMDDIEKPKDMICHSIGYLTHESKTAITITPHLTDITNKDSSGCGFGFINIPKKVIIKRTEIKL